MGKYRIAWLPGDGVGIEVLNAAELVPELQGKGLSYRSPIVRMRQLFDLYDCLRPGKACPGNALNFDDKIDIVVFRENTEDLYAGVEFGPVPAELAKTLSSLSEPFAPFAKLAPDEYAVSSRKASRAFSSRTRSTSACEPSSARRYRPGKATNWRSPAPK